MQGLSLLWGVFAFLGCCVALIPCLGWLNWLNIPFALGGAIFSAVATARAKGGGVPGRAIAGLVLNTIASFLGLIRLLLGGGVF
jgi:hypothetical protein